MRLGNLLLEVTLIAAARAQQTSPKLTTKPDPTATSSKDSPEPSPTGPKTHTIDVGTDGYSIEPNPTYGNVGDTLEWRFYSGEHWIVRGTLDYPCIPRQYIFEGWAELSSGPMKVDEESDEVPVFRAEINDTDTILFYSGADGACVDHKMMGAVNPQRNNNLVNYKSRAQDVEFQLRPGDSWPEDKELPSTTAPNIPTTTDDSTQETSSSPTEANDGEEQEEEDDDEDGLSKGAIAGLAVGGTLALIIFGLAIFYCGRRGGVKILFTKETPDSPPQGQYPRYETPPAAQAPFRPPRTPHTENWRPTMDHQGTVLSRTASPAVSMRQQSMPVLSPYKTGEGAQGYMPVSAETPPAGFEQRHIASYYDPNLGTTGSGRPLWMDVQYSRASATPIELPTSADPGNSPLPQYHAGSSQGRPEPRKFSWSGTGEDALFSPSRV